MKARGFTLVELVMVIVITGILAASVTMFVVPAVKSYFDTRRRADLTDMADTALRRMSQDIRRAVPNSIRAWGASSNCVQMVPTIAGGRYRMAADIMNVGEAALDITQPADSFDVLSPLPANVAIGDWVVIDNQNRDDVYASGVNRSQITAVETPPPPPGGTAVGQHRLTIGALQFPVGYDGGRFVVVKNTEQSVFYTCDTVTTRRLYRIVTDFGADPAASCALTSGVAAVVATDVENCTFAYDPNHGATQQSGFVSMRLKLARDQESITLGHGAHVDNVP